MISEAHAPSARRRLSGRIVAATHNAGKLREIEELLGPYGVEAIGAGSLGLNEPEETGLTFSDNAVLKAEVAARASGQAALSDDSGFCVAALGGARFARGETDRAASLEPLYIRTPEATFKPKNPAGIGTEGVWSIERKNSFGSI